jgi:hypothetical protein
VPIANRMRLMNLADHEFKRESSEPSAPVASGRSFRGWRLNIAKFDQSWDRKRGSAMRMTGVLLNEDSAALQARVCADERATDTYASAADWLAKEAQALRKTAKMHETVSSRLRAVIDRCRASRAPENQGLQANIS